MDRLSMRAFIEQNLGSPHGYTRLRADTLAKFQADFEKNLLEYCLERCGGNQSHVADVMRLNRNTVRKRTALHGLPSGAEMRTRKYNAWAGLREQKEPVIAVADPADWVTIDEAAAMRHVKNSTARTYMCTEGWDRKVVGLVLMVSKRDVLRKGAVT